MQTLKQFWNWADTEKPNSELFWKKAVGPDSPVSEEAREAIAKASEVMLLRLPVNSELTPELQEKLKVLSFAVMAAWSGLPRPEWLLVRTLVKRRDAMTQIPRQPIKSTMTKEDRDRWAMQHAYENDEAALRGALK